MAVGPYVAALSEEEYERFTELEARLDRELVISSRTRVPALVLGVRIERPLTPRMKAAVKEVYASWKQVEFEDENLTIWFQRDIIL